MICFIYSGSATCRNDILNAAYFPPESKPPPCQRMVITVRQGHSVCSLPKLVGLYLIERAPFAEG